MNHLYHRQKCYERLTTILRRDDWEGETHWKGEIDQKGRNIIRRSKENWKPNMGKDVTF